ncbi:MAG: hypothetical protein AAGF31_09425 [Planctomycetota bacterium]
MGILIRRDSANQVVLGFPENPIWESVINNVRFVGDELHFDQYFYFVGPDDFTMPSNPSGDHPFSGVRNHIVLALVEDEPDKLLSWLVSDELPNIEKDVYQRASETIH